MTQLQAESVESVPVLQLLLRPSCMLCLEAEYVLSLAGIDTFERIDIEREDALEARYGVRIPVLRTATGRELDWPFGAAQIHRWIGEIESERTDPGQSSS